MRSLLPPEARFLLLSAGGHANDAVLRSIVSGPFDWGRLLALALADRATPVIWRRLQLLGCHVPDGVAGELRRVTAITEFRLMRAEARLRETIAALDRAGIRVVLLKGAAVARTAYRSITERPMADFDLLIEPGKLAAAQAIAREAGWTESERAGPDAAYRLHHHGPPLDDGAGTGMRLELHTALFAAGDPFRLSPDLVRRRSRPIDIAGSLVGLPSRPLLLLHACLHLAWSHAMREVGWRTLRDIHRLTDGHPEVWDELVRLAIEVRGVTCCYWTLRLARDVASIPVPDRVLARLAPPVPEIVRTRIARHFALHLLAAAAVGCPSARIDRAVWGAAVRPGWSGHSTARPWDRDAEFVHRGPAERGRENRAGLVARHWARLPAWRRYFRAVLIGAPSAGGAS
jgi:hypothetical protein